MLGPVKTERNPGALHKHFWGSPQYCHCYWLRQGQSEACNNRLKVTAFILYLYA